MEAMANEGEEEGRGDGERFEGDSREDIQGVAVDGDAESTAEEDVRAEPIQKPLSNDGEPDVDHKGDSADLIGGEELKGIETMGQYEGNAEVARTTADAEAKKGANGADGVGVDDDRAGLSREIDNDHNEPNIADGSAGEEEEIAKTEAAENEHLRGGNGPPRSASDGSRGGDSFAAGPTAATAPEWPVSCDPTYRMPEELVVRVLVDGEVTTMSIRVEKFDGHKAFHGGYRHKGTGRVYHHASTQFGQQERPVKDTGHLRTRDTQTCRIKSTRMQTTNECGTQMARKDMHLDNNRDTSKTAGEYQTAAEYWRVRERKTVVIQRFWRGFSARNKVWTKRAERWARQEEEMETLLEEENRRARQGQREMQRRMNPSTAQDFEVMYNELDQWRRVETKRVKQAEGGERRQLALRELLHKETRLLQTIDRLKITAAHEGKERRTRRMLDLMSAPKKWEMGDGEIAEVTTPWTTRAKELQELYEALEAPLLSVEERLDVLLHLKWTVSEFDCRLTRDIAELVDREADLLSRGRGEASLHPLRQRIRNLFLRFAETPDFNPEATRFVRVPPKYKKLTDDGMAGLIATVSC